VLGAGGRHVGDRCRLRDAEPEDPAGRACRAGADPDQDAEWCEVELPEGRFRVRFHDYAAIYAVPGLYERLFYDELDCSSPRTVRGLLEDVMRERGYPTDDFDQRAADISVDHPRLVENYRTAHAIAVSHERGEAGTEELRQSIVHYRSLFVVLVPKTDRTDGTEGTDSRLADSRPAASRPLDDTNLDNTNRVDGTTPVDDTSAAPEDATYPTHPQETR